MSPSSVLGPDGIDTDAVRTAGGAAPAAAGVAVPSEGLGGWSHRSWFRSLLSGCGSCQLSIVEVVC